MVRRPLRPHFCPQDQALLLQSVEDARRRALKLGASLHMSSPRYRHCQDLHKAIDVLARSCS